MEALREKFNRMDKEEFLNWVDKNETAEKYTDNRGVYHVLTAENGKVIDITYPAGNKKKVVDLTMHVFHKTFKPTIFFYVTFMGEEDSIQVDKETFVMLQVLLLEYSGEMTNAMQEEN